MDRHNKLLVDGQSGIAIINTRENKEQRFIEVDPSKL